MPNPDNQISDVLIVGGGDSGLMTALTLNEANADLEITVIDNFDEPVSNVGKSTISYIMHTFHEVLDIDRGEFVRNVKPVWKASIRFDDWCGHGPFQSPFDTPSLLPAEPSPQRFEELYYRYQQREFHTLGAELALSGRTPFVETATGGLNRYDNVAYHLSTERLNTFLRDLCLERRIGLINDEVTGTETEADGQRIRSIQGRDDTYDADLYVDATSFERVLMADLDTEFISFDSPLDSAATIHVDRAVEDIVPATVVNSGTHGWRWQIDTLDNRSLGYVYSSGHVSDEAAVQEFIDAREELFAPSDVDILRFDSGCYRNAWTGNCIAVGNALGFVEPLQSTALTLNAVLTEKLAELVADHNCLNHAGLRDLYNAYAWNQWTNVYDFIALHYKFVSGESAFWEDATDIEGTDGLDSIVADYEQNGFTSFDEPHPGGSRPGHGDGRRLFDRFIFYRMLQNLSVPSAFYDELELDVSDEVESRVARTGEQVRRDANAHLTYPEVDEHGVYEFQ